MSPEPLLVYSARRQEYHAKARLDPHLCCHLVHLPWAVAAFADLAAVEKTEGGCAGRSAIAHLDFLPNGAALLPVGNLPENTRELEI